MPRSPDMSAPRRSARRFVVRERLLAQLDDARIVLVEAAGGYGKTVLAEDLRERLGIASALVSLEPADADPAILVASLRRALRTGLLSDLAASLEEAADPDEAVERLVEALAERRDPVLVAFDDVHHASDRAASSLIWRLASSLPPPHRAIVMGRRLPGDATRIGTSRSIVRLGTDDLAFAHPEVMALLEAHGATVPGHAAEDLRSATGGWPAALALWAPRIARAEDPMAEVREAADTPALLGALLGGILQELDPVDRSAASQLAHLRLISEDVAAATGAPPGVLERLQAAGLPFADGRPGWTQMPDPVAEHLATFEPLRGDVAVAASRVYARNGEVMVALLTLLASGHPDRAAALLAGLAPAVADRLDPAEIRAVVDALPSAGRARHPRALLQLARALERTYDADGRASALAEARVAAEERGDAVLAREIGAEIALDLVRDARVGEARALATSILRDAGDGEVPARARALDCLGRLESLWGVDVDSAARGAGLLREAALLAKRAGHTSWAAGSLYRLTEDVLQASCRYDEAIRTVDEALALLTGRGRARGLLLQLKAGVLVDAGLLDQSEAVIDEARAVARILGDARLLAYVAWTELAVAAGRRHLPRAKAAIEDVERHRGDWFEGFGGLSFLAFAADVLDRLGDRDGADRYLDRARRRASHDEAEFRWAEAMITARSGEPATGRRLIEDDAGPHDRWPRVEWRLRLLRAFAALRAGDDDAAALAAEAFEYCAMLGVAATAMLVEPAAVAALLPVAVDGGSEVARALSGAHGRTAVRALGAFEVTRGGRQLVLAPGRPSLAVKALVVARGRMHSEELIEALWPEVDPPTGRARLRNLLNRIRATAPDLVRRDGEVVLLSPAVEVDVLDFEDEANRALAAATDGRTGEAVTLARSALGRYRGTLLPDDPYEPWAAAARERLRTLHVRLLDMLAVQAEREGDVDEAGRLLHRAIAEEQYDEIRYVRLATLLAAQGRIGSAREVLDRAREALTELGLEPSFDHDAVLEGARPERRTAH